MPAVPVAPRPAIAVPVPQTQGIFERGDKIYVQTPVQRITPSDDQIEEYAFSKAVKQNAPNENIVWFKGSYVEADRANQNGAQWHPQELAIKSLTPMLMPVTVMHDPRTAVGTIADTKLYTPEKDKVPRTRIDTVLALWGHRFPEAVHEAEVNASEGTLMQSMECFSPWYECSECGRVYHKLPQSAEQAQWCDHLKASQPSGGYVAADQTPNASRILGDVCFTGTGLIFGSRGAKGAYSEAFLDEWEDEVATYHTAVHTATATTPRSASSMGLVNIEQSELDLLRKERDDARADLAKEKTQREQTDREKGELEKTVETKEAEVTKEKERADAAEAKVTTAEETAAKAELKSKRWDALGDGFVAKLGDHTKSRLQTQAEAMSDEDWDARLTEVEELAGVKRDAKKDGATADPPKDEAAGTFSLEEIAAAKGLASDGQPTPTGAPSDADRTAVVGKLGGLFSGTGAAK